MGPTLLIGVDGATFAVLDPYIERGVMPFLGGLIERGARARLRSVDAAADAAGLDVARHGQAPRPARRLRLLPEGGSRTASTSSSPARRTSAAPTIWSIASEQDRRVISLNFPLMFPPPAVEGCVVPGGMMPWRQLRLGCHPPGLFDRLKALPGFNPREMLNMELEIKAIEGCPDDEYADWVELHITREQRWFEVARLLMHEEPADLVGVMFDGVDKLQHLCWRFIDPACRPARPSRWEREMIERCERYFRTLDAIIAELVDHRRPGGDRRLGVRPRLRADARGVPRQLLARAGGLSGVGGCAERRGRRGHAGRVRGGHPPRARARLGADARLCGDAERSGHQHREPGAGQRHAAARGRAIEDRRRAGRGAAGTSGAHTTAGRSWPRCGRARRRSRGRTAR